jgi:hypothetical protein
VEQHLTQPGGLIDYLKTGYRSVREGMLSTSKLTWRVDTNKRPRRRPSVAATSRATSQASTARASNAARRTIDNRTSTKVSAPAQERLIAEPFLVKRGVLEA